MNKNWLIVFLLCLLSVGAGAYPHARTLALPAGEDIISDGGNPYLQDVAVVGTDERHEITGKAVGYQKAVVTLEMITLGGKFAGCSGSLIAPNVVLTAGHCLSSKGKYHKQVLVLAQGLPAEEGIHTPVFKRDQNGEKKGEVQPKPTPQNTPFPKRGAGVDPNFKNKFKNIPFPGKKGAVRIPQKNNPPKNQVPGLPNLLKKQPKQPSDNANHLKVEKILKGLNKKIIARDEVQVLDSEFETTDAHFVTNEKDTEGIPYAMAAKLWVAPEYLKITQSTDRVFPEFDYGLVFLDRPLGEKTGHLDLGVKSDEELNKDNLRIYVTGRGGDKKLRSLWESKGRVGKVEKNYFYHNVDMTHGNSGGPIVDVNDPTKVFALNNNDKLTPAERKAGEHVIEGRFPNIGLRLTQPIVDTIYRVMKSQH